MKQSLDTSVEVAAQQAVGASGVMIGATIFKTAGAAAQPNVSTAATS